MIQDRITKLDDLAAPNNYVVPSTRDDRDYIIFFRQVCKRYNIDFSGADQDERDFIMKMADKGFCQKHA